MQIPQSRKHREEGARRLTFFPSLVKLYLKHITVVMSQQTKYGAKICLREVGHYYIIRGGR